MLAKVYSCAVIGLQGAIVEVEVDTANGLPTFVIVGPPRASSPWPICGHAEMNWWEVQDAASVTRRRLMRFRKSR
jgi:hypothetical protein